MTFVNLWLSPARAVVLSDTMTVDRNSVPDGVCSKVAVLPRLNAVVAVRGAGWCLERWARWFDRCETLEEARHSAAHCTRELVRHYQSECPSGPSCEFISLAWDAAAGRVIAWVNIPDHDFKTIAVRDGTHALPWIPGFPTPARVPLLDVARQQFAEAVKLGISADAGREWTQATVTRRGVSTRLLGTSAELGIRDSRPRFQYDIHGNRSAA